MPAVLTELAFIDNGIDYSKLSTENGRQVAAEAIYEGFQIIMNGKGIMYLNIGCNREMNIQ